MRQLLPPRSGFIIPRIAVASVLCLGAALMAYYGVAGNIPSLSRARTVNAPVPVTAGQPPFAPVENSVTLGGLTLLAKTFASAGKVNPGETFPVVLIYKAGAAPVAAVTIKVTLHNASLFQSSIPGASSGNGTAGSPLVYTIPAIPANGTGQIAIEARAKNLTEDPEVMWKDVSANVTLMVGAQGPAAARTHGPKVTTLESAVYGDRPFPVVMVQYQDIKHCTAAGVPFPECTGNHTAANLDTAMNSRTSKKSIWQLFQDMSFGQLFPDAKVNPAPNTPDVPFSATPGYPYKWSSPNPRGFCNGTTTAVVSTGAPPYLNRIEGGWYQLPGVQGYYGSDSGGHGAVGQTIQQGMLAGIDDGCGPTGKAAYDAAAIADPDIDYNDFDTDKDGVVDFFNMVFAGDGGNLSVSATGANNIWPHSSDLRSYYRDANWQTGYVSNDQFRNRLNQLVYFTDATRTTETTTPTAFPKFVRVGPYNVNPESALDFVSVIAHEYGHSLGMPDLYSTGGRSTFGSWDLNASDYFQYSSVFARQDLGWVVPRPLKTGAVSFTESKFDTGQIDWQRPDGTPYTLTGPGIHNAEVYRLGLPPRILIDEVPSGVRAWYSGSGNDFGCASDGGGHNLDFFIPDLQRYASAGAVTLKIKHLWEMEWDYDYGFVLVSKDNGVTWKSLPSKSAQSSTISNTFNPQQNQCQATYNNGITGVSDGQGNTVTNPNRINNAYPPATFVQDQFDLTEFKGQPIILRFSYSTDPGLAKRGWFIDDIEVTADSTVVYKSDFEKSRENTRIFPFGWSWVSSTEGSPADHAYYLELRARISNDFDGKGQSERGAPGWEGGISMIYTDEAHGYGNTGVDNPPAQSPVDAAPDPGSDGPNLNDAAFTLTRPTFNGCTHIDNYSDPNGPGGAWKLPPYLKFTVTGISGLTQAAAIPAQPATATIQAEIYPTCASDLLPPALMIGSGYENPDTDGAFQLKWQRPAGAIGPDELQVATSCGPTFADPASTPLVAGDNALWDGTPQWTTNTYISDPGNLKYYIPNGASQDDALTQKTAVAIPNGFASTLTFDTVQGLEAGFDFGYVEVSTNNGASWKTVASYSGPGELPDQVFVGTRTIDLTEFAGQSVKVRFRVESDAFNIGQPIGWYIDNITITNSDWTKVVQTNSTAYTDHKPTGSYCYRVSTTTGVGAAALRSPFSNVVGVNVAAGIPKIVSRKKHGAAQNSPAFDIPLNAAGPVAVESRQGPAAGKHQIVFKFTAPPTYSNATVTPAGGKTAQVESIVKTGNEVAVNLMNVSNAQQLTVTLLNANDGSGPKNIPVPLAVLLGDVNSTRLVDGNDVSAVQRNTRKGASATTFRFDVNATGLIDGNDVSTTQSMTRTRVP